MSTRVVLSTDAHPNFGFFLPLTCVFWREVAGYIPLVLTVGDMPSLPLAKTTEIIRETDIVRVTPPAQCGKAAAAQLVRLLAYLAPGTQDNDWLLMGDVDAWPLQADAFKPRGDLFLMYDANCLLRNGQTVYPMGYIATTARSWYHIMGVGASGPSAGLEELFRTDPELTKNRDPFNYDEHLVTRRLNASGLLANATHVVRDGFPIRGRIDRAAWPANVRLTINNTPQPFIDAHLLRPGWSDENWLRIRQLLEMYLTPHWLKWCDDYRAEWMAQTA